MKMKKLKKLFAVYMIECMLVGCLGLSAWAAGEDVGTMTLDQEVRFTVTQEQQVLELNFCPAESGTYVLYDTQGGYQTSHLKVLQEERVLAQGNSTVAFQGEAGAVYRLRLEGVWEEAVSNEFVFQISRPSAVTSLTIDRPAASRYLVGMSGALSLRFQPLSAAPQVQWTSDDLEVVTVTGDAAGAVYQLVGPGTATLTAATEDGTQDQIQITVQDAPELTPGVVLTQEVRGDDGGAQRVERYFRFTATDSGEYALMVDHEQVPGVFQDIQLSLISAEPRIRGGDVLRFTAEAGKTYYFKADLWGVFPQAVEYQFLLAPCTEASGLQLSSSATEGYINSEISIQVDWDPKNGLPQDLTWTSSDESVVQILESDQDYAAVMLLSPGTATITARTEKGLMDQLQITVYPMPQKLVLTEGQGSSLTLISDGYVDLEFTPQTDGYYQIRSSHRDLSVHLYADSVEEGIYYLQAGTTYTGSVDNYSSATVTGEVVIEKTDMLMVVGMKITKLPDDTVYLKSSLKDVWTYQLLAGMEMEISWSDGSTSSWRFDEEGPYVDREFVSWQLVEGPQAGKVTLQLSCGLATTSCELSVEDKQIVGISLVEDGPLKVVERSCGMDNGDWYYFQYLAKARYVRISFSDGSAMDVRPGQKVYGYPVTCQDSQLQESWVQGGPAYVTYEYCGHTVQVEVQIVDSPVERIELIGKPRDRFTIGDPAFFSGRGPYYFAPADLRDFLEGMELRICYLDGTARVVDWETLEWEELPDGTYPFLDGYPLGLSAQLLMGNDPISQECEKIGTIEYMGSTVAYTIYLDEQPVDPPVDPTLPTDPTDPTDEPTEPTTEPSQPSATDPSPQPSDPTEQTDPSQTTRPSQSQPQTTTDPGATPPKDRGWSTWQVAAMILAVVVAAAGIGAAYLIWSKKKK